MEDLISTERLMLRPWTPTDYERLMTIFAKPVVWHFPFRRGFTADETKRFLDRQLAAQEEGGPAVWAAESRAGRELIGYVGLSVPSWLPEVLPAVEVGWRFDPEYWGNGLATEGGAASLDYGFETLGLDEILAIYEPENVPSGQVMRRLGMQLRSETSHPAFGCPLHIHSISSHEWLA